MQDVVSEKPYRFVPARHSRFWPALFQRLLPRNLRKEWGVARVEVRGIERLKASLDAGHRVILTPNHCRPCDPMVVGMVTREVDAPPYTVASSHLFHRSLFMRFLLPRLGVFSVYREGLDRESLKFAVQVLREQRRPLLIFPEGVVTRTNDRLNSLMEGPSFIARSALRVKTGGPAPRIVIHPVAIRYFYDGPHERLEESLGAVITETERRLSWTPDPSRPLRERIERVGMALLALHEIEFLGEPRSGSLAGRIAGLLDGILRPLEAEWTGGRGEGDVVSRVKALRAAILPGMIQGELEEPERERRRRQLRAVDLAQEISFFPPGYFGDSPTSEQLLETVDRIEESLTGDARIHRPLRAVAEVCAPIEVGEDRPRGEEDPVMLRLRTELQAAVLRLKASE